MEIHFFQIFQLIYFIFSLVVNDINQGSVGMFCVHNVKMFVVQTVY